VAGKSPTRIINTGKPSEAIFEDEVTKLGGVVFRLRDQADLVGLNKNARVKAFGQPSDFFVVSPLGCFMAEVKSSNNKTSFSLDCFTRTQKAAMARCHLSNSGRHYRIYIHNLLTNVWYRIDATTYVTTINSGSKSIKWSDLKPLTIWMF